MIFRHFSAKGATFVTAAMLAVALVGGCKGNPVPGDWKDARGAIMSFKADGTVTQNGGGAKGMNGKWTLADKVVAVKVVTIAGMTPDRYLESLKPLLAQMDPKGDVNADIAKAKAGLDKLTFKMSDDGKTMTVDVTGAPAGAMGTLTKVEK